MVDIFEIVNNIYNNIVNDNEDAISFATKNNIKITSDKLNFNQIKTLFIDNSFITITGVDSKNINIYFYIINEYNNKSEGLPN